MPQYGSRSQSTAARSEDVITIRNDRTAPESPTTINLGRFAGVKHRKWSVRDRYHNTKGAFGKGGRKP